MQRAPCILFPSFTHAQAVESLLLLGLLVLICDQEHRGLLHFQEPYIDLNYHYRPRFTLQWRTNMTIRRLLDHRTEAPTLSKERPTLG